MLVHDAQREVMRSFSNRGQVIVRGQFAPIVGNVSMDLTAVDVTDVRGVSVGDVVTVYGMDHGTSQSAAEAAHQLGTVCTELLCALGRRVPRVYLT